jgi:Ser/Thr protein kinase RdoA (MazF antagonist)
LPTASAVLHVDFHPLNVFLAGSRATVIDWADASPGPAAADIRAILSS